MKKIHREAKDKETGKYWEKKHEKERLAKEREMDANTSRTKSQIFNFKENAQSANYQIQNPSMGGSDIPSNLDAADLAQASLMSSSTYSSQHTNMPLPPSGYNSIDQMSMESDEGEVGGGASNDIIIRASRLIEGAYMHICT